MSKRRIDRLNEQLRREVAEIVQYEVKDPRVGPVTVTGARVSPDLQQARLFVTLVGSDDERSETLAGLDAARPFIRSELARRLDLRRAPELRFQADESLDYALHIERLLGQVLPAEADRAGSDDANLADADGVEVDDEADDEADDGADDGERGG